MDSPGGSPLEATPKPTETPNGDSHRIPLDHQLEVAEADPGLELAKWCMDPAPLRTRSVERAK